jgi:flagellar M-ring protein FliF
VTHTDLYQCAKLLEGDAGLSNTYALRQIGLMAGLVASVMIGAAVVLWLWIPGSDDSYGGNSTVYSSAGFQNEGSRLALQSKYIENNNRVNQIDSGNRNHFTLSGSQLEYTQKLETSYTQRIERLLAPLLGADSIRAQVTADIDFTSRERTLETYNPDTRVLRNKESEEIVKNSENNDKQPVLNKHHREVNSYEIDKTINRTRSAVGRIDNLSIAVIIDDKFSRGVKGNIIRTPRTEDELNNLADLVKKSVGFNAKRGDTVNVIGARFKMRGPLSRQPQGNISTAPTWGQVWMKDLFNKSLGTLLVLLLIFSVIRPSIKSLVSLPAHYNGNTGEASNAFDGESSDDDLHGDYEKNMERATKVVESDPKLVAQIMKNWVSADGA